MAYRDELTEVQQAVQRAYEESWDAAQRHLQDPAASARVEKALAEMDDTRPRPRTSAADLEAMVDAYLDRRRGAA